MEDEVLKALELLYSQGKTEAEVLSIVEESGFADEADKIKEFYKKKSTTEDGLAPSELEDGDSVFNSTAPLFDPIRGVRYAGIQGLAQPLRSGEKKDDAWFIVDDSPSEISRIWNRGHAQGMIANMIAASETGVAPDWEDLAYYNRVLRDNAVTEEDVMYSDSFLSGLAWDAIRIIPESFISMGTAAPAGLTGAGAGAVAGSAAGPAGTAVGGFAGYAGGTSLAIEYGNTIMQSLQEAGVDIYDGQALLEAQSNPEIMAAAREHALKRGLPVAAIDAVSGGTGGRITRALLKAGKKRALAIAAEAGVQGALGGAGEVAGAVVSGEEVNWRDVALEAIAEIAPATPSATYEYFKQKAEIPAEREFIQYQQDNQEQAADVINAAHLKGFEAMSAIDEELSSLNEAYKDASILARRPIKEQIRDLRSQKYTALNNQIKEIESLGDAGKAKAVQLTNEIISLRQESQKAPNDKVKSALNKAMDKKYIELQKFYNDSQKKAGVPSDVQEGQAPIEGEPIQKPSVEAPAPSGVVQEEQIVSKPVEVAAPNITPDEASAAKQAVVFTRGQLAAGAAPESSVREFNRALGVLYNVNPDVKLVIHQDQKSLTDSHQDATDLTEGYYNQADNTIHILANNLKKGITEGESRVLRHEVVHPILNAELAAEPRLRSKFVSQINEILSDGSIAQTEQAERVRQTFSQFGELEGITEFLAQFTTEEAFQAIQSKPTLLDKIKKFLNKLIKRILPKSNFQLETSQDTYEFLSRMKDSFQTGKAFRTASTTNQASAVSKIQASTAIEGIAAAEDTGKFGSLPIDEIVRLEDGIPVGIDKRFEGATPMFQSLSDKFSIPFIYVNSPGANYTSKIISLKQSTIDMVSLEKQALEMEQLNNILEENGYQSKLGAGQTSVVVINTASRNYEAPIRSYAGYFAGTIKTTSGYRNLVSKVNGSKVEQVKSADDIFVSDAQEAVEKLIASNPSMDREDAVLGGIVTAIENILKVQSGLDTQSKVYSEIENLDIIKELKTSISEKVNEGLSNTPYTLDNVDLSGSIGSLVHFLNSEGSVLPYSGVEETMAGVEDRVQVYLDFLSSKSNSSKDVRDVYVDFYEEIMELGEENVIDTSSLLSSLDKSDLQRLANELTLYETSISSRGAEVRKFVPFFIDASNIDADVIEEMNNRFKDIALFLSRTDMGFGDAIDAVKSVEDYINSLDNPESGLKLIQSFLDGHQDYDGLKVDKMKPSPIWRAVIDDFRSHLRNIVFSSLKGDLYHLSTTSGKSLWSNFKNLEVMKPYVPDGMNISTPEIDDLSTRKMLIYDQENLISKLSESTIYAGILSRTEKAVKAAKTRPELRKALIASQKDLISKIGYVSDAKKFKVSEDTIVYEIPVKWQFPNEAEVKGFRVPERFRGKTVDDKYTVRMSYDDTSKEVSVDFSTDVFGFTNVPQYLNPGIYFSKISNLIPYAFTDRPVNYYTFAAVEESFMDGFEPTTSSAKPSSQRRAVLYNMAHKRAFDPAFDLRAKEDLAKYIEAFGVYTLPAAAKDKNLNYFYFSQDFDNIIEDWYNSRIEDDEYDSRVKELLKKYNPTRLKDDFGDMLGSMVGWNEAMEEAKFLKAMASDYNAESKWGEQLPVPKIYSPAVPMDAFTRTPNIEESRRIVVDKKKFKPIKAKIDGNLSGIVQEGEEALVKAANAQKKTFSDLLKDKKVWWDRQADIRKKMRDSHLEYVEAVMDAKQGYIANANKEFSAIENRIYSDLTSGDIEILDEIIYFMRVIQIDKNFDVRNALLDSKIAQVDQKMKNIEKAIAKERNADKLATLKESYATLSETIADLRGQKKNRPKHTPSPRWGTVNRESAEEHLAALRNKLGDKYTQLEDKATEYFKEFNNIWLKTYEAGLISKDEYIRFKDDNYAPRIFLSRLIDADVSYEQEVFPKGLKDSQIKAIKEGSEGLVLTDSRVLLSMAIKSLSYRKFNNKANSALAQDALTPQNSDWVREANYEVDADGQIVQDQYGNYKVKKADVGFENVFYREGGKTRAVQMAREEFIQWNDLRKSYFNLSPELRTNIRRFSGSNILRAFATGINPVFAIMNAPAELGSVLLGRGVYDGYKFLPMAAAKLAFDYSRGLAAAYKGYNSELLQEAFEHGVGMMFLSNEGRPELMANRKYQGTIESIKGGISKTARGASWLGEATEIGLRLAVYQQAKENFTKKYPEYSESRIKYLAAAEARRITDFSAGGTLVKDLDNALPYLNAAAQGFRANVSYVKQNPAQFLSKLVQAGIGVMALAAFNEFMGGDDEEQRDIPPYMRERYFIIMTPYEDEDGNRKYIRVKKPQTFLGPIRMFEMLGESMASYMKSGEAKTYDEAEIEMAYDSFTDAYPFFIPMFDEFKGIGNRVPVVNAFLKTVANYDAFRDRMVSPEKGDVPPFMEGYGNDRIEYFYKAIAQATSGLPESQQVSPTQMKALVETFVTSPTNNIVTNMSYSILDWMFSGIEVQDPTAQQKGLVESFGTALQNAAGSAMRSTNPDWRNYSANSDVKSLAMEAAAESKKVNVQLKEMSKKYKGKTLKAVPSDVVSFIETLEPSQKRSAVRRFMRYVAASGAESEYYDVRFAETPQAQAKLFIYHFGTPQPGTDEYKEIMQGLNSVGFRPTRDFKLALQEEIKRVK